MKEVKDEEQKLWDVLTHLRQMLTELEEVLFPSRPGGGIVSPAKYIWMVHGDYACDVRRYAHTHKEAIAGVSRKYGLKNWNLYKLVRVNKRRAV